MDVDAAREADAEDAVAYEMQGEAPPRTQGLQFDLPEDDQRDPDTAVVQDGELEPERAIGPESADE